MAQESGGKTNMSKSVTETTNAKQVSKKASKV